MTSSDQMRAAFRRSRRLVAACVVVGVVAMLALGQLLGTQYQATSSVIVQGDLQALSIGSGAAPVDTQTEGANAATLATSPAFSQYLATLLRERDPKSIQNSIIAQQEGTANIVDFTASASTAGRAQRLANAAATAFPAYSRRLSVAPIGAATRALRAAGASNPQAQATINRLRVLQSVSANASVLSHAASASRTRPRPARELLEGLVVGLVVGLLIMALREGIDSRARVAEEVELELDLPVLGLLEGPRGRERRRPVDSEAQKIATLIQQYRSGRGGTVITVVGTTPREGRTWVVATLAGTLHEQGASVCAVDDGGGALIRRLRRSRTLENGDQAPRQPVKEPPPVFDGAGYRRSGALIRRLRRSQTLENGDQAPRQPVKEPPPVFNGAGDRRAVALLGSHHGASSTPLPTSETLSAADGHRRRLVVLPAWATSGGLDELRSRFDWIIVDASVPSEAPRDELLLEDADAVVLVVPIGGMTLEQLTRARAIAGWSRSADAVILTTAR